MKIRKFILIQLIVSIIIVFIFSGILSYHIFIKTYDPKHRCELYIKPTTAYDSVINQLAECFQIKNRFLFESIANYKHLEQKYKPGYYRFDKPLSITQVINRLIVGDQTAVKVIFNSLPSLQHLAGIIGKQLMPDSADFIKEFTNQETISRYGFNEETFMVMFLANTYEMWWTTTPQKFVERMSVEYQRFWTIERKNKAEKLNLTPVEVSLLASIVEKETVVEKEMPIIAGVYLNRLRIKMPLQADPTVIFAVGNPKIKRVTSKMLEIDSPYNTYKRLGLPPGPICLPSIKAIEAVLNAEKHNYLYFCASPELDGTHRFAATSHEHSKNAAQYRQKLNALKIFN
ncbi:MAG TPA: endolytic transglycosylase MltG [Salinivirgaceae bacterium]|nr:endolytic transglycosylase MltG [Salinivirgaceae bacterium]